MVVNTCTVTNQADAQARRFIRRARRLSPDARIVVAGCSAALRPEDYAGMAGVAGVVKGHDPVAVAAAALNGDGVATLGPPAPGPAGVDSQGPSRPGGSPGLGRD